MKKTKTESSIDFTSFDFDAEMAKIGLPTSPKSLTKTNSKLAELPKSDTGASATSPFWVMLTMTILTVVLSFIPFAKVATYPFQLFTTFIHEISHTIAALITGGQIVGPENATRTLTVNWDTSGQVYTAGGIRFIISSAGYVGSALFGCLLMMIAKKPKLTKPALFATGLLIALFTIIYGGTFGTFVIGAGLVAALISVATLAKQRIAYYFLSFLSIQSVLNALYSIRELADYNGKSDATNMTQAIPFIPEFVWTGGWMVLSLAMVFFVLRNYYQMFKTNPQAKI